MVEKLTELGIYSTHIMEKYTKEDIEYFSGKIQPDRDWLFDYLGLYTLATRYLATDHDKNIYELPQERWMIIAMYLMQDEDKAKDRKSTRLNSSHVAISYAVFCLKKKTKKTENSQ